MEEMVLKNISTPARIAEPVSHKQTSLDHLLTTCRESLGKIEYQDILLGIANVCTLHGDLRSAEKLLAESLDYGNQTNRPEFIAEALYHRGDIYCRQGKWKDCAKDLTASRKVFSKLRDVASLAKVDNLFGTMYGEQGLLKRAGKSFSHALHNAERSHQHELAATISMNLGIIDNITGNFDNALNNYKRALSLFESTGNLVRISEVEHNIGMSFFSKKNYSSALRAFDRSLEGSVKINNPGLIGIAQLGKANIYFRKMDSALSLALCNQAFEHFEKTEDRLSIADVYKLKGMIFREMKEYGLAMTYFQSSMRINEEYHNKLNLGETLYEIGVMEKNRKRKRSAIESFRNAHSCFKKVGAMHEIYNTAEQIKLLEK